MFTISEAVRALALTGLVAFAGRAAAGPSVELRLEPTTGDCEVTLGLDLGAGAGLVAVTPEGLVECGAALASAGDALVEADAAGLTTRVSFDGRNLEVGVTGACRSALDPQLLRLEAWARGALPAPGRLRLERAAALDPIRAAASEARAAHLALGSREPTDLEAAATALSVTLESAPATLRVRGPIARAEVHAGLARIGLTERRSARAEGPRAPEPRVMSLAPGPDGSSRVWLVWSLGPEAAPWGPAIAALLDHPGGTLAERLLSGHGLADRLSARWLGGLSLLVLGAEVSGPDVRAARDRLLLELGRYDALPEELAGALTLVGLARGPAPATLGRLVREELTAERAVVLHEPPRLDADLALPVLDAEVLAAWVAATVDVRCPAPGEARDRTTLLREVHGLDPKRYLALSRWIGRDAERLRQLDGEVAFRCQELAKLRALLPPPRLVALHRAIACGALPDDAAEASRRGGLCRRAGIDPSAYRPLVAMARREPALREAIRAIDCECGRGCEVKP